MKLRRFLMIQKKGLLHRLFLFLTEHACLSLSLRKQIGNFANHCWAILTINYGSIIIFNFSVNPPIIDKGVHEGSLLHDPFEFGALGDQIPVVVIGHDDPV